jgi:N-acetylated-alpha-linked acidic dipeptidase
MATHQPLTPPEEALLGEVDRDRLWRDTEFLGSMYRKSGSDDERRAVQYIVDQLTAEGIGVDVYELDAFLSYHLSAELTVLTPEQRAIPAVARGYTASIPDGIVLQLAVAGPEQGDLTGKAVLTARDWPNAQRIDGATVEIHAQITEEPNLHRGGGTGIWGTPSPEQAAALRPGTTAINIARPDGEWLRSLARKGPVTVRVATEVETSWKRISFPVATISGPGDTFVLTGGHLDGHDPGVTDNATGCACLLELARLFHRRRHQLRHGLRIGWWTGHESAGYAGSTFYCDNTWEDLHHHCLLYWNNDGPGIRRAVNIEGRYIHPHVQEFVLDLIRTYYGREPDIMAKPLKMGDQSFLGTGVPSASVYKCLAPTDDDWAVVFGAGHGRWWHSTEDTLDKADPDNLLDDTKFYSLALWRLLTAERLPFEYVTYADWMIEILTQLRDEVGERLDLSALAARAERFRALAEALDERAEMVTDQRATERINACLMRLSRHLSPVFFTAVGPHGQDLRGAIPGPAVRYPLPDEPQFQPRYFPGLQRARLLATASRENGYYAALYTQVLRERNRVSEALDAASREIRETLAAVNPAQVG